MFDLQFTHATIGLCPTLPSNNSVPNSYMVLAAYTDLAAPPRQGMRIAGMKRVQPKYDLKISSDDLHFFVFCSNILRNNDNILPLVAAICKDSPSNRTKTSPSGIQAREKPSSFNSFPTRKDDDFLRNLYPVKM